MKWVLKKDYGNGSQDYELVPETEEERREWQEYRQWYDGVKCHCKDTENRETYYVPDGVDEECTKHHWRCTRCDGIVQIG